MSELMQEGNYRGTFENAQFTEAQTGTLQMAIVFKVGDRRRTVFLPLTDNTIGHENGKPRMAQRVLDELGYNGDEPPTFSSMPDPVELYCKHDTYNDETKEKWMVSGGAIQFNEAPKSRIDRFRADWRAVGRRPSPAPKAPPPSAPPQSGPPAEAPPAREPGSFKASTKDEAWQVWEENGNTNAREWHDAVRKVGKGRAESEFTAADWEKVAAEVIPFRREAQKA